MPANTPRALQVYDPVLTNLARRYKSHGFIADQLVPDVPVATLTGQYPVFTKAYWFQNDVDNLVADRAPAREVDFEWGTESYYCREYALKVSITDLEKSQAIAALHLEQNKTEFLTLRMQLAHEIRVANLLRKTTNSGSLNLGATPGTNWDTSVAIETDIQTGVNAIYDATGMLPNVIVIPFKVAYAMALNATFSAKLRYDATGKARDFIEVGEQVLPSVIHGMQVVIPMGAQVDTSREGGTSSISEIWGDHVRMLYVDGSAQWGMPTVAQVFRHTAKRVTRWSQTDPDVDYIRELERYDLKCVAPDVGYELTALLS